MSDPYTSGIPPVPDQETYVPPVSSAAPFPVDTTAPIETKILAMICHFGGLVPTLIIWYFMRRGTSAYLDYHGKEALNFQITVFLAVVACMILSFIVIGALILPLVVLASFIFGFIAAVNTLEGKYYKYPWALRLIK